MNKKYFFGVILFKKSETEIEIRKKKVVSEDASEKISFFFKY